MLGSSCSDWLTVYPTNEQVTDDYWKSEEDVEAVLSSGYYYMRKSVGDLIDWGELRGSSIYKSTGSPMQQFQMLSTSNGCDWSNLYKVINMANSVLEYAPGVLDKDDAYSEAAMNSNLCEAYFLRALTYFYLVRNFKEVPLVLKAYVDDSQPMQKAKSSETEIIAQIKKDIETALNLGAAKEFYDGTSPTAWSNKGRGTVWALYALMADVCLWSQDWDGCITYADKILNANATFRPVFLAESIKDNPDTWFSIFNPGNSQESIFELQFSSALSQKSGSPSAIFTGDGSSYQYSDAMIQRLISEAKEAVVPGRAHFGACIFDTDVNGLADYTGAVEAYIWKYIGGVNSSGDVSNKRTTGDANFIIYRVTDIILMKAEALIWKGGTDNFASALELINKVRVRAGLPESTLTPAETDELTLLNLLFNERDIEFAAEGKRWYDLMRFGRSKDFKYKTQFIQTVADNNQYTRASWVSSVLADEYSWFLPIADSEIKNNTLLEQNPYYAGTSKK